MKNLILMEEGLQAMCDYAVQKIVEQGGQCIGVDGFCAPVSKCGTKFCAFSQLVDTDAEVGRGYRFDPGGAVTDWQKRFDLNGEEFRIMIKLQNFHDTETITEREEHAGELRSLGIDTSAPQYKQWIEMGA